MAKLRDERCSLRAKLKKQKSDFRSVQVKNQILQAKMRDFSTATKKLQEMGIDFQVPVSRGSAQGRSVVFTFCGPAGLIEGGSNQKIALIVDTESLTKVQDLRTLL